MINLAQKIENIFPEESQIPQEFQILKPITQREYLINGEIKTWKGNMQEIISPICIIDPKEKEGLQRKIIGQTPSLSSAEALKALDGAVKAYNSGKGKWPTMPIESRIRYIQDFAFRMKQRKKEVVLLIMWEIGKNLKDSEKEFDRTVEYIEDTINALKDIDRAGSRFVMEKGIFAQIRRAPLGVVLCMGPYNYPLNETFATLIPALIMGNTVVFKPPKLGVLLYQPLLQAMCDSFPKGVINTVYGEGEVVIPPLMSSGKIDVLAFIGSSKVADILKKLHPQPHRLRSVLGLGAKNAAILLPDIDLEKTVEECVLGSLSYNGQRCTALKIFFVHKKIADKFVNLMAEKISQLKIGMPWDDGVQITPLPVPNKPEYLAGLVSDAQKSGAKVVNAQGGKSRGTFFFPALIYPVNKKMEAYHKEQFGPLVPVASFESISEPVNYIINSHYGQQASIFGKDSGQIAKLVDPLVNQVSRVNINSQCQRGPDTFPFTGRKDSAEGTLSVTDALRIFSIRTLVAAKDTELNKEIISEITRQRKSNFLSTDFIL